MNSNIESLLIIIGDLEVERRRLLIELEMLKKEKVNVDNK